MLEIELESETATNWNKCNRDDGMVA